MLIISQHTSHCSLKFFGASCTFSPEFCRNRKWDLTDITSINCCCVLQADSIFVEPCFLYLILCDIMALACFTLRMVLESLCALFARFFYVISRFCLVHMLIFGLLLGDPIMNGNASEIVMYDLMLFSFRLRGVVIRMKCYGASFRWSLVSCLPTTNCLKYRPEKELLFYQYESNFWFMYPGDFEVFNSF